MEVTPDIRAKENPRVSEERGGGRNDFYFAQISGSVNLLVLHKPTSISSHVDPSHLNLPTSHS